MNMKIVNARARIIFIQQLSTATVNRMAPIDKRKCWASESSGKKEKNPQNV